MSAEAETASRRASDTPPGGSIEKGVVDDTNSNNDASSKDEESGTTTPAKRPPPGAKAGMTLRQFWITMVGLNIGMLLTALDFNIVATAVPIISSEFQEYNNSAWLGTGFLISFAIVMPVIAKLGDVFGRKDIFLFSTVIFFIGSALCGWSNSMSMLIGSRLVQGAGAGGIYGLVNVILTDLVELQDVGKYLSATAVVWGVADVAGPLLGGAFSQYATWRWCFWINLFISPVSFGVVWWWLNLPRPDFEPRKLLKFDYCGTLLISGGTACFVLGLAWGGNNFPWDDSRVIGVLVGGVALMGVFVVMEHFAKDPLIFPYMFKSRTLLTLFAAEFFYGMTLLGSMYYVPQFFQLVFGDTATMSGVGLLPMMLGLAIGNPAAAWVTSRYGITVLNAAVGACFEILALGLMTRWNADTSRAEAICILIVLGIGQGAVMSGLLLSCQVAVPPPQIGIVTGLAIFIQTVGDIFGIAIFATVYVNKLRGILGTIGLDAADVKSIMMDVAEIRDMFDKETVKEIVEVYAESLQNGWWLLFAAGCTVLISTALSRQHKFASS